EKNNIIDGNEIVAGDVLIGLASNGLHTNGYSLARKVLFDFGNYDLDQNIPQLKIKLGEVLLTPHRNYLKTTLTILKNHKIKGIAHITGGSFRKNIPRILPKGVGVEVNRKSWQPLPIFGLIQSAGNVPKEEMYSTFNMGIGYVYVIGKKDSDKVLQLLRQLKENAYVIGRVIRGDGVGYVD
ncbi:MAG: AIR synthase-related protein, partial [Nanoarchaeota archaeon]